MAMNGTKRRRRRYRIVGAVLAITVILTGVACQQTTDRSPRDRMLSEEDATMKSSAAHSLPDRPTSARRMPATTATATFALG